LIQPQAKQFIDLMERQQLLSPDVLDELRRQVAESKTRLSSELIAKLLVENGHLTKFQATKLIAELKDAGDSSSSVSAVQTEDEEDELGFADEQPAKHKPVRSSSPASSQVAQVIVDDEDLEEDLPELVEVVEVVEVTDADVVEVVEVVPVQTVERVPTVPVRAAAAHEADGGAFGPAAAPVKRVMPPKKSAANPYDSFRILGVALLLALVSIAGFFLVNYFWRGNADDRLKRADDAYEQRSYETASVMYGDFARDFPGNEKSSYARVRTALANIRKDAEGAPDPQLGLETALRVLPAVAGEAGMNDQQSDLAGALIALAAKFNERTDRTTETAQRKLLMQDMDRLLGLINDPQYVGTNQRSQQAPTLNRILEDQKRILREINRDEQLAAALQEIDQKLAARDTLAAYDVRKKLINLYPLLEVDPSLSDRVRQASVIERSLVKPAELDLQLAQQSPDPTLARSFLLSHRTGQTIPALNGQVLFVKAKGSVYGFDAASGDILWRQFVGREFDTEPFRAGNAAAADAIICQPAPGRVARLAGKTGDAIWWAKLGQPIHSPVLVDESLFVATRAGVVASLDADSGQQKWATQLPQSAAVAPSVAPSKAILYVPAEHSNLFVLSREDGSCQEVLYLGHRAGSIAVAPVLLLGQLFIFENISASTTKIRILATSDQGLELKESQTPITMEGNIVVPPQVDGRHLIVQTDLGQIKVLDIEPTVETQKVTELVTVSKNVFSPKRSWLTVDNNRVWVVDNQLTRFDLQLATMNMSRAWIKNDGDRFVGPPQRFGNVLIHTRVPRGSRGIRVSAVAADSGSPLWETDVGIPVTHIAASGTGYDALNTSAMLFTLGNKPIRTAADSDPAAGKPAMDFTNPTLLRDGRVVMANRSRSNQLAIFDPASKTVNILSANIGTAQPASDLVAVEDKVVVGLDNGQLVTLNMSNGALAGSPYQPAMQAGKKISWNTPVYMAESKTLIVSSELQRLVRLSVGDDLRVLNEVTLESPLVGPLAAVDKQVCGVATTAGGDSLQFFDATSLKQTASVQLPGTLVAGPFALPQPLQANCLVQVEGRLLLISEQGQIAWSIDFPKSSLVGPPAVFEGNLLIATRSGEVWNIATESGQVVGNLDLGQALSSPPLIVAKNVLLGSDEGAVLAVPPPASLAELAQ
jgi:outer membrane protein assembly factor BamB